jgi:hypothetical protein
MGSKKVATRKAKRAAPNVTIENVRIYRTTGILPKALTLRFLALLNPKELRKLSRALKMAIDNHELPNTDGRARKRRQWAQYERVQSEIRQRETSK